MKAGDVYCYESTITKPPKEKFIVLLTDCASEEDRPLFFFINSEVHRFIKNRPHLLEQQISISPDPKGQGFLKGESYISCHETKIELSVLELRLFGNRCGTLSSQAKNDLCESVRASNTIAEGEKRHILNSFGQLER